MRIPPGANLWIQPQVFIANVVAADPCARAVNDHGLPMIPEIELKTVAPPFAAVKRVSLNTGRPQFVNIRVR